MAEPKKRLTRTRSGNRQSHQALKRPTLIACSRCKTRVKPHYACYNCGYYKDQKVLEDKKEKVIQKKKKEEIENE